MRVLVVEDDPALGIFLLKVLQSDGYSAELAGDGDLAVDRLVQREYQLLILDLNLPRRDGTEVLREVRMRNQEMGVLVLTGRAGIEDRVRCLDLGADDCLVKPFALVELQARCRALARRRGRSTGAVLRCGDLELNRIERTVIRAGRQVELTLKEFALLEFLLQNRGLCVSRATLLEQVWRVDQDSGTGTNVVDVYINYLRRKLGDEVSRGFIETVRGNGYCLREPDVAKEVLSNGRI